MGTCLNVGHSHHLVRQAHDALLHPERKGSAARESVKFLDLLNPVCHGISYCTESQGSPEKLENGQQLTILSENDPSVS